VNLNEIIYYKPKILDVNSPGGNTPQSEVLPYNAYLENFDLDLFPYSKFNINPFNKNTIYILNDIASILNDDYSISLSWSKPTFIFDGYIIKYSINSGSIHTIELGISKNDIKFNEVLRINDRVDMSISIKNGTELISLKENIVSVLVGYIEDSIDSYSIFTSTATEDLTSLTLVNVSDVDRLENVKFEILDKSIRISWDIPKFIDSVSNYLIRYNTSNTDKLFEKSILLSADKNVMTLPLDFNKKYDIAFSVLKNYKGEIGLKDNIYHIEIIKNLIPSTSTSSEISIDDNDIVNKLPKYISEDTNGNILKEISLLIKEKLVELEKGGFSDYSIEEIKKEFRLLEFEGSIYDLYQSELLKSLYSFKGTSSDLQYAIKRVGQYEIKIFEPDAIDNSQGLYLEPIHNIYPKLLTNIRDPEKRIINVPKYTKCGFDGRVELIDNNVKKLINNNENNDFLIVNRDIEPRVTNYFVEKIDNLQNKKILNIRELDKRIINVNIEGNCSANACEISTEVTVNLDSDYYKGYNQTEFIEFVRDLIKQRLLICAKLSAVEVKFKLIDEYDYTNTDSMVFNILNSINDEFDYNNMYDEFRILHTKEFEDTYCIKTSKIRNLNPCKIDGVMLINNTNPLLIENLVIDPSINKIDGTRLIKPACSPIDILTSKSDTNILDIYNIQPEETFNIKKSPEIFEDTVYKLINNINKEKIDGLKKINNFNTISDDININNSGTVVDILCNIIDNTSPIKLGKNIIRNGCNSTDEGIIIKRGIINNNSNKVIKNPNNKPYMELINNINPNIILNPLSQDQYSLINNINPKLIINPIYSDIAFPVINNLNADIINNTNPNLIYGGITFPVINNLNNDIINNNNPDMIKGVYTYSSLTPINISNINLIKNFDDSIIGINKYKDVPLIINVGEDIPSNIHLNKIENIIIIKM
jgi:hypothetical protein